MRKTGNITGRFGEPRKKITQITLPNHWRPRLDQMALWGYLENGGKRAFEMAHRRWGKDDVGLHFTATQLVTRPGNYWHMLPEYGQARKSIWTAINPRTGKRRIDEAFPVEIRSDTKEQEMLIRVKPTNSTWQLVGSDNYNSLIGSPPVGVVFSEWAVASPLAWPYLQPILEENDGWALFVTTPRGNNHAKKMLDFAIMDDNWFGQKITADESPVFTKEKLKNIKRELIDIWGEEYGEALFLQEYYCSTEGAQLGAYFAKQINLARTEKRITNVPWQPGLEVDTFWDLGIDDSMTIWFIQVCGQEFHFIDYYENMGYGLEHYAKIMKDKPYVYGNHYMPHDANAREMTNNEIALSRREVAENLGIKPIIVVPRVRNMDILVQVQIPAVRNILGQCWFDEKKCFNGISALEGYQAEYDEEKKKLGNRPKHDWTAHASSAFITFAIGYQAQVKRRSVTSIMNERVVMSEGYA